MEERLKWGGEGEGGGQQISANVWKLYVAFVIRFYALLIHFSFDHVDRK